MEVSTQEEQESWIEDYWTWGSWKEGTQKGTRGGIANDDNLGRTSVVPLLGGDRILQGVKKGVWKGKGEGQGGGARKEFQQKESFKGGNS